MTTGNTSSENTNIAENCLPQVSEFCILRMKEQSFILLDAAWLYEFYHSFDDYGSSDKVYEKIRTLITLEDLIDCCVKQKNDEFINDIIQPAVDDNTISAQAESDIYANLEGVYVEMQERIAQAVDFGFPAREFNTYNLVGFLGLTAIIALSNEELVTQYPSFKELYGNPRDRHWESKISNSPVLKAFIPIIQGKCEPV